MNKQLAHVHESKVKRETYLLTEIGLEKANSMNESLRKNGIESESLLKNLVGTKAMKASNLLSAETEISYAAEIIKGFGNRAASDEKACVCRHLIKALEYLSRTGDY